MNIDKKDLQILSILDWNARMPITQIAKKVKLNKDVIRYRIKNLEEKGIISGYYSLIDIAKLGYLTIRVYFDFVDTNEKSYDSIINHLNKTFSAGVIFSRDGEYNLGVILWEKSVYEFQNKLKKFKELFGDYINKINFTIFTEFNHYSLNDLNEDYPKKVSIGSSENVILKDYDFKILKELSKDSRINSVELSERLKIPQTTVIHRIRELEKKKVLLSYRAKIDFSKLDYANYFLEVYTHNGKDVEEIEKYIKNNKNCTYSVIGVFGCDIEIECEFKGKDNLLKFINELQNQFKSIRKIKYCSTLKYYKLDYFPE